MMTAEQLEQGMRHFTGTESYHRVTFGLVATDGVKWLCENAECYWLLDAIASHQPDALKDPMLRDMQFWTLTVRDNTATLVCERDSGDVAIRQRIAYTDFPLPEVRIWVQRGVAMIPNEY